MRAYSLSELFTFTRAELFALHARIVADLSMLSGSDSETALENLRKLRQMLSQSKFAPP